MSSFICPYCGKEIIDTPTGYITGCEHFPLPRRKKKKKTFPLYFRVKEEWLHACPNPDEWRRWRVYKWYRKQADAEAAYKALNKKEDSVFEFSLEGHDEENKD